MEKQRNKNGILSLFVICLLAGTISTPAIAQQASYIYYDSLTYRLYQNNEWEALAKTGMKAVKEGHDAYYLQLRTGIALFNQNKFRKADRYLSGALEISPNAVSSEYAYLTKLWGGRNLSASLLRKDLPVETLKSLDMRRNPAFNSVDVSYSSLFAENEILEENQSTPANVPGSRLALSGFRHYGLSFSHISGNHSVLHHGIGFLNKTNTLYIGPSQFIDSYWTNQYNSKQFNYYLNLESHLGNNWNLNTYGNGLIFTYPQYNLSSRQLPNGKYRLVENRESGFDYLVGATIRKSFSLTDVSVSVSKGSFGDNGVFQTSGNVVIYPFYNLNFYVDGHLQFSRADSDDHVISRVKIGGRITNFLWLEVSSLMADKAGLFHLNQGNLVFNGTERVDNINSVNVIVLPAKNFKCNITWQQRDYSDYFVSFGDNSIDPLSFQTKKYQLISTSLTWTF